jgi:hypothetical protein
MCADMLARWLRDTVTIARGGGTDAYGQPTGGATITAPAVVMRKARREVDASGVDFISTTQFITAYPVHVGDRVTIDAAPQTVRTVRAIPSRGHGVVVYEVLL